MVPGIEELYRVIADSIVDAIAEPWSVAKVEAIFFPDSITFEAEYLSASGRAKSFATSLASDRAFRELRRRFRDPEQAVWGQALFELHADGKFTMKWGYDGCDENGDTIWDALAWSRRQNERQQRLSQP